MDPIARRISIVALLLTLAIGFSAAPAGAGFEDDIPYYELHVTSLSGPEGTVPKGDTATYSATLTNQGNIPTDPETTVGLYTWRVDGDRPVPNPFHTATVSDGRACAIERIPTKFGDYHSASCPAGDLAPGQSIEVAATVEVNESMDFEVEGVELTTLVDAPPELTGSSKLKVRGLPDSCVANDFNLTAKAKGAKKVVASLVGPLNAEGKPPAGEFAKNKRLGTAKGSKLKAPIDADSLELGYYELKVAAKYDGKPKQKAAVFFQRC